MEQCTQSERERQKYDMRKEEVAGGGNVLREQIKIDTNIQLESVTQVQLDEIQYDAETT